MVSFPLAFLVIRTITETNYEEEGVVYVDENMKKEVLAGHDVEAAAQAEFEKGREEREKMQKAYDEKIAKERRKSEKAEKGQKSLKDMFGGKGKKKEAEDED